MSSFSFKRSVFNVGSGLNAPILKPEVSVVKAEDWGDYDDDDEIMDKFVLVATQVEKSAEIAENVNDLQLKVKKQNIPAVKVEVSAQKPSLNAVRSFRFDTPTKSSTSGRLSGAQPQPSPKKTDDTELLRKLLVEKDGEVAILREQLSKTNLKLSEMKDDLSKQALGQKRHYEQTLLVKENDLNLIKTQLNFKEIDLQTLEQRCKKLELKQIQVSNTSNTEQVTRRIQKRPSGFDYFERDAFDTTKRTKPITANAAVQTTPGDRSRKLRQKVTVLSSLTPGITDVTSTDRLLRRFLHSLSSALQSNSSVDVDFSRVEKELKNFKISNMSDETITVFTEVCGRVRSLAPDSVKCADFLCHVIEPYIAQNVQQLKNSDFPVVCAISDLCRILTFRFEERLPNLLIMSSAVTALEHNAEHCDLLPVLMTKKKESLYQSLLDSYREALKFVLTIDVISSCSCLEEFMKQLYYSIEDNFTSLKKFLERHMKFKPTSLLDSDLLHLYCNNPTEVMWKKQEGKAKTDKLLPFFRRILLNTEFLNSGNIRTWVISGLQSLKLLRKLVTDDCDEIDFFLEHLSNPWLPGSVLENKLLERAMK